MFELIKNFRTKTHNPMRENATELLAHFSGSLAALRLARKPEKRTLNSVQQRNLGSWEFT